MKIKIFLLVFIFTIFLVGNLIAEKKINLDKDTFYKVKGKKIKFMCGESIIFYDNGNVKDGILAEDTIFKVQGKDVKLKGGSYVNFHENGSICEGTLAEDTVFKVQGKNVKFKGDIAGVISYYSNVLFDENGNICEGTLAETVTLKSIGGKVNTFYAHQWIVINPENEEVTLFIDGGK